METTDEIVDLEARYHDLLGDVRRPLVRFVEVSLAYGRRLAEVDLERAHAVFSKAIEALHDPPAPSEVELAIELLGADEAVAGRLGDIDAQVGVLHRLRRVRESTGGGRLAIDLRRRSSRVLASVGRSTDALAELRDGLADAHDHGALGSFEALITDLVVIITTTSFEPSALEAVERFLRKVRTEHPIGPRRAAEGGWVRSSLIGLAALRVALDDASAAQIYLKVLWARPDAAELPALAGVVKAQVALAEGDLSSAATVARQLIPLTALDPRLSRIVRAVAGRALAASGGLDDAQSFLEAVCTPSPGPIDRIDVAAHTALADLYAAAGHHDRAFRALRLVVAALDPASADGVIVDLRDQVPTSPGASSLDPSMLARIAELEAAIEDRVRAFDGVVRQLHELESTVANDPLTGLVGRDGLRRALAERLASGEPVTVLSVDLDRFGRINESFGHDAGDALLVEVAERLNSMLGPRDVVARWGGDEFLVVVAGMGQHRAALAFADALRRAVAVPWTSSGVDTVPPDLAGRMVPTVSVGVTVGRRGEVTVDELVRQADAAGSAAKAAGRDRVEVFGGELGDQSRRRLEAEALVRDAIDLGWFELHYQPIFSNANGRPDGAEALLRIRHPERGLIAPLEFLGAVEEAGLGPVVGEWVLDTACAAAARWAARHPGFRMAVNVAPTLLSESLPEMVLGAARRHRLDPSSLVIELTEHAILEVDDRQVSVLASLREQGVRIALDDFGTAYSSLLHLRRFQVDVVKIDRTFVAGIAHHPHDAAIVHAIVGLSHAIGFRVVAEGVETAEQFDVQRRLGCFGAQGYLLGRPQPEEQFDTTLAATVAAGVAGQQPPAPGPIG